MLFLAIPTHFRHAGQTALMDMALTAAPLNVSTDRRAPRWVPGPSRKCSAPSTPAIPSIEMINGSGLDFDDVFSLSR